MNKGHWLEKHTSVRRRLEFGKMQHSRDVEKHLLDVQMVLGEKEREHMQAVHI